MEVTESPAIDPPQGKPSARGWLLPVTVSAALVIPCFWRPIVSAVDLQSHLYNAWLAELIGNGSIHGLWIGRQSTNTLIDLLLLFLLKSLGAAAAERIVATAVVLVFFWGAFSFVSAVRGGRAYWLAPWIAMFAYGYTFQMGLLNYYLACGLVLWVFGAVWRSGLRARTLWVLPVLCLAWLAHPIPVLWLVGLTAYGWMARRMPARIQGLLFLGCAICLVAIRLYLAHRYLTVWTRTQLIRSTGADQFLLHGGQYLLPAVGLLVFACVLLCRAENRWKAAGSLPAQLYALTVFAIVAIPSEIRSSMETAAASLIADRLSLLSGVLLLALVSRSAWKKWYLYAGVAAATFFFAALYQETGLESRAEARIEALVAPLPAGARVLPLLGHRVPERHASAAPESRLRQLGDRVLPLCCARLSGNHLLDRACLGHCYDYANYEPATDQFRIHAAPGNAVVLAPFAKVIAFNSETYVVQAGDVPAWGLVRCGADPGEVFLRPMREGESTGSVLCPAGAASK